VVKTPPSSHVWHFLFQQKPFPEHSIIYSTVLDPQQ